MLRWTVDLLNGCANEEERAELLSKVTTLGWFIWKEGNNFIFNHSPVNPTQVIIKAAMSRRELLLATERSSHVAHASQRISPTF